MHGDYVFNVEKLRLLATCYSKQKQVLDELENKLRNYYASAIDEERASINRMLYIIDDMSSRVNNIGNYTRVLSDDLEHISVKIGNEMQENVYNMKHINNQLQ